ncbi:MAG: DNA primase, partial [Desulfurococcaceae archaeon]
ETINIPVNVIESAKSMQGTLESIIYSADWSEIKRLPVRDLVAEIESMEPGKAYAVLMDGIITQRLINTALNKNIKLIIGARIGKVQYKPVDITILTYNELFF